MCHFGRIDHLDPLQLDRLAAEVVEQAGSCAQDDAHEVEVDLEAATRKRVRDVFRHAGFVGWRNEGVVRGELEEIADEARHHSEAGRAERALEILVAAASEIVAHFDQIDDSNA